MKAFVSALEKELAGRLRKIESSDLNVLKKSLEASLILGDAFQRLREFVSSYTFKSEAEEIEFFKTIKPRLFCRLIYYRKVYNIEMNRPVGIESQHGYLHDEIKAINRYNDKHSDFVRYYRSGMTHLDSLYYLRNRTDAALYLESFHYERDPKFSTNADFMAARIMANKRLADYLSKEIETLELQRPENLPCVRLTWGRSKTDLLEQIFAWDSCKAFGNVPMNHLLDYIATVFNIKLDPNYSRTFCDMRIRNKQTSYLDELKEVLLARMNRERRRRTK
ncbi:RteC domain-containing protein [Alistipes ihumii]|uniref:RteC domain-containing protein n=1 Tax=Alistipes ihumii TaxID=1470347 RepID=UPI002493DF8B|nr:RteC domain-containing protein [Alistipes ihumii]